MINVKLHALTLGFIVSTLAIGSDEYFPVAGTPKRFEMETLVFQLVHNKIMLEKLTLSLCNWDEIKIILPTIAPPYITHVNNLLWLTHNNYITDQDKLIKNIQELVSLLEPGKFGFFCAADIYRQHGKQNEFLVMDDIAHRLESEITELETKKSNLSTGINPRYRDVLNNSMESKRTIVAHIGRST